MWAVAGVFERPPSAKHRPCPSCWAPFPLPRHWEACLQRPSPTLPGQGQSYWETEVENADYIQEHQGTGL